LRESLSAVTEKVAKSAEPREKPYEIPDRGGKESIRELRLRIQPSEVKTFYGSPYK
jgi:hypothetical protein